MARWMIALLMLAVTACQSTPPQPPVEPPAEAAEGQEGPKLALACLGSREAVGAFLARRGLFPTGEGTAVNGARMETFTGRDGSWAWILTLPGDIACVVANGGEWHAPGRAA